MGKTVRAAFKHKHHPEAIEFGQVVYWECRVDREQALADLEYSEDQMVTAMHQMINDSKAALADDAGIEPKELSRFNLNDYL